MSDITSPSAPAADVSQALRVDIQRLQTRENCPPQTMGEIAKGDGMFNSAAQRLIDALGGVAAVEELSDHPHIDEEFDWSDIAESDHARVNEILRLISSDMPAPRANGERAIVQVVGLDKLRPHLLWCDPEYRTIAGRILRALALDPARPLDRRIKAERIAAAIMWVGITASGGLARSRRMKPPMLWDWFEVSSCKRIGRELADHVKRYNASVVGTDEVDVRDNPYALSEITLGNSSLLHSTFRGLLVEQRDDLLERIERQHQRERDAHPLITNGLQGRLGLRSRPVTVRWAMRGENEETGRACVSVALGESLDDIELLGLSIPDARRLIEALQCALDGPIAI